MLTTMAVVLLAMDFPLGNAGIVLTIFALAITGYYVVKSRKITAQDSASANAVTGLTGELAALTSKVQRIDQENIHLRELLLEKDKALARNERDITELREALTQRAAVEEFRAETREWFSLVSDTLCIPAELHPKVSPSVA